MKQLFEIEWNDDLGEGWMNVYNLELCLFSKEHTKRELVRVKEITQEKESELEQVEKEK